MSNISLNLKTYLIILFFILIKILTCFTSNRPLNKQVDVYVTVIVIINLIICHLITINGIKHMINLY